MKRSSEEVDKTTIWGCQLRHYLCEEKEHIQGLVTTSFGLSGSTNLTPLS